MRSFSIAVAATLLLSGPSTATTVTDVLVSGEQIMFVLDADQNGPDPGDCLVTMTVNPPSFAFTNYAMTSTQDAENPIRGCGELATGTIYTGQDSSSDHIELSADTTTTPPPSPLAALLSKLFYVPGGNVELIDEVFDGDPDGIPLNVNQLEIEDLNGDVSSFSTLCAGPTIVVDFGAIRIPVGVELYPDSVAPTHLKLANIPLERAAPNLGSFTVGDLYIPVKDRHVTVSYSSAPDDLLVDVDLDNLGPCPGVIGAPTLTQWGLIALAALLMAGTVWRLRQSA